MKTITPPQLPKAFLTKVCNDVLRYSTFDVILIFVFLSLTKTWILIIVVTVAIFLGIHPSLPYYSRY